MPDTELFDEWPERYEAWFTTPIGGLVRRVEGDLVLRLLQTARGERILDAGCGTGVFTTDVIAAGADVTGLDISRPMLRAANRKTGGGAGAFASVQADMRHLPFAANSFDKAISVTAVEFIEDARAAIDELFRVTRPGGLVLVATLNRLSPWAERRIAKTVQGQRHILENAFYRSGEDLLKLSPYSGITRTAVHFQKDDEVSEARATEAEGARLGLETGAFVVARWQKPATG
jgi:ubiquinone/menaquinone biosynthesis C-methylase UbiE